MGNVIAAAPPVPPPLPTALVVEERTLRNPGTVEDLHKKTKGIFEALQLYIKEIYFRKNIPIDVFQSILMEPRLW